MTSDGDLGDNRVPCDAEEGGPGLRHVELGVEVEPLEGSALGKGAFGMVRKARWIDGEGRGRLVAVKYANELTEASARRSLENELKVFDALPAHPHIIRCFGGKLGEGTAAGPGADSERCAGDDFYIVLELMDMNLDELIRSPEHAHRCTYAGLLDVFEQVADGLEHLHAHNIIHYDMKPGNVLLSRDLRVKLADFGLSKMKLRRSTAASCKGQFGYMAPEVALSLNVRGLRVTDKVDVFSLGVMMWECVSGKRRPSLQSQSMGTRDSCMSFGSSCDEVCLGNSKYTLGLDCPKSLVQLIEQCVELQPDNRPSSMEVRTRLGELKREPWAQGHPWGDDLASQEDLQAGTKTGHFVDDSAWESRHLIVPPVSGPCKDISV
ncbi:unnamed protein product [Ostreobium quekettii]|uniref:Protein kinase domain-containing protein n=1 Tax=Ostreobium quekettii TaxID=121088 RepID=A0A8S1J1M7_9CHLO|nr:unnamed protein product [Ostreobium quekettii]|eukprot:evm.model.scf_1102.3 EVM.evm.TU.scf_1102.3   scf_1102:24784-25920(+)